jgi:phage-related protein (TIGR01555 family)
MAVRAPLNQLKLQEKPRVRRPAGSSPVLTEDQLKQPVTAKNWQNIDSFQNFVSALGMGANNQQSAAYYGFNPVSRNHTLMEWMYRGSWLVKRLIDCIPDDMTRAGVSYTTTMDPKQLAQLGKYQRDLGVWHKINQALKWARLYGGAGCYIMIKGQRPDTPLRLDSIGKGQFAGLIVLDRWMLWPHLENLVTEPGPYFGKPMYYDVVADGMAIPRMRFHYSRFIRFEGMELPYWQYMQENFWGCSIIEPIYDRIIAFDSATTGASQLVYKAHLRTYAVEGLRELIAAGGQMYQAFLQQVNVMRLLQNNEGLTVIDAKDKFETHQYAFSGLSDMLIQFSQQLSGGAAIPLTRLFGQSPAGLSATGDADIRNYYDQVNSDQESRLRDPYGQVLECMSYSLFGRPLPDDFDYYFNPLWQMSATEKAQVASSTIDTIDKAFSGGLINQQTALKELQASSKVTGIFTNITDEDIEAADAEPPSPPSMELSPGMEQQQNAENPQDDQVPGGENDD